MDDWPATLPQKPLQDGFSSTQIEGRIRTSMSEGPEKVRRRFTAVPEMLSCSFHFTTSQLAEFNNFFTTTLAGGSLAYNWDHPITLQNRICRIHDLPKIVPRGADWQVSFTVEVLP